MSKDDKMKMHDNVKNMRFAWIPTNFWNNVVLRDPLQSVDSVDRGTYAMEFLKHIR